MKLIGKETQRKIDLQIQSLQERVAELENQLSISKNEKLALNKDWQEEKNSLIQANAQIAEDSKAFQTQLHAVKNSLTSFQLLASQDRNKLSNTLAMLDSANVKLNELTTALSNKSQELEVSNAKAYELSMALEAAQLTNHQISTVSDNALKAANDESIKSIDELKVQVETLQKSFKDAHVKFTNQTRELTSLNATLASANEEYQQSARTLEDKVNWLTQQKSEIENQLYKATAEFEANFKSFKGSSEKAVQSLKADLYKQAKVLEQTEDKYQHCSQENELLLLQLIQAQEELGEYYDLKGAFEKLYKTYNSRWDRLEKSLPSYLHYHSLEIVDVDGLSDAPTITWLVKDFAQAGLELPEFSFVTCIHNGHPGIGLVKEGIPQIFVPKLLRTDKVQLNHFVSMCTTDLRQIEAAVSILTQLESGQWQDFEFPNQFDLSFWRPSLRELIFQVPSLPIMLRFDAVKLKRELINPDYEHLWFEFNSLSFGKLNWKKFEIRLGAALVETDGFSKYPKFEIPLIDGKFKPFDSWFAESHDESGAKLELRFALEKNVFDQAVWVKLNNADKALFLRLIYVMPEVLSRLESQKTAINRSWSTWIEFANGAIKVLASYESFTSKTSKSVLSKIDETNLPLMPSQLNEHLSPTMIAKDRADGIRIISVTNKPKVKSDSKSDRKSNYKTNITRNFKA